MPALILVKRWANLARIICPLAQQATSKITPATYKLIEPTAQFANRETRHLRRSFEFIFYRCQSVFSCQMENTVSGKYDEKLEFENLKRHLFCPKVFLVSSPAGQKSWRS